MSTPDDATDPDRCRPCRGTGTLISNRGGTPHEVPCPWCDGTGRFQPGHDAQRRDPAQAGGGDAVSDA